MEKLIIWTQYGPRIKGLCMTEHDFDLTECRILGDVASRLGGYEDSGLSPEEVFELARADAENRILPEGFTCVMLPDDKTLAVLHTEDKRVASEKETYYVPLEVEKALGEV